MPISTTTQRLNTTDSGYQYPPFFVADSASDGWGSAFVNGTRAANTTEELIWAASGNYIMPTAQDVIDIVSTSANDNPAGTGMRQIYLQGTDANFDFVFEIISLNGTTTVTTVNNFFRLNYAFTFDAGTSALNEGNLTLTHQTSGDTLGFIPIGWGNMLNALWSTSTAMHSVITAISYDVSGYTS